MDREIGVLKDFEMFLSKLGNIPCGTVFWDGF